MPTTILTKDVVWSNADRTPDPWQSLRPLVREVIADEVDGQREYRIDYFKTEIPSARLGVKTARLTAIVSLYQMEAARVGEWAAPGRKFPCDTVVIPVLPADGATVAQRVFRRSQFRVLGDAKVAEEYWEQVE